MYLAVGDYEASERQYAASIAILEQHATQGLQVRGWTPPVHWPDMIIIIIASVRTAMDRANVVSAGQARRVQGAIADS
jgi:hypothetical protein